MKKILTVLGARPQFIKASVVSKAFLKYGDFEETILHTGQHYDENMSDVFFQELDIPKPGYHLGIGSGQHGRQTGQMLSGIEHKLLEYQPDFVLVYGDTNSTLAGALAAAKLHIPVIHIEAGLRSFNKKMPEEINRVLTDHVSSLLFAPTSQAVENLKREGIEGNAVSLSGDVMFDVALAHIKTAEKSSGILEKIQIKAKMYALATIHRAENTDKPARLLAILEAFEQFNELPIILPLHPRTRAKLIQQGWLERLEKAVHVIDPVGYLDMIMLEKYASLIITDSGGVQKEAFFYQVPCVTLRDETEWGELVDLGWNRLVDTQFPSSILRGLHEGLVSTGIQGLPYGTGNAVEIIVERIGIH